jgi:UDPglucose--hexose-1-phosphate uridylyltransferase
MSELRKDPVVSRWVIVASDRGVRPNPWATEGPSQADEVALPGGCPFCESNERMTPHEVMSLRDEGEPDQPGWYVRVVPHKFPVLRAEGQPEPLGDGLRVRMDGIGAHEIVIEHPRHDTDLAFMRPEQIMRVFAACIARMRDLRRDPRFEHIAVFRNHRREAGATLDHPHSQIVAFPLVPHGVAEQLQGSHAYFAAHARCVFCDITADEVRQRQRVVMETDHFVIICPYASPVPYGTQILPRRHCADLDGMGVEEQADLARAMQRLLIAYRAALSNPPYNLVYHTAPVQAPADAPYGQHLQSHYHWHAEIAPRLTGVTGAEWGTGFPVNPVSPEEAAVELARNLP